MGAAYSGLGIINVFHAASTVLLGANAIKQAKAYIHGTTFVCQVSS